MIYGNNSLAQVTIDQQQIDTNMENSILQLVNKYGLLGFKKRAIKPLSDFQNRIPTIEEIESLSISENTYYPRKLTTIKRYIERQDKLDNMEYGEPLTEMVDFP